MRERPLEVSPLIPVGEYSRPSDPPEAMIRDIGGVAARSPFPIPTSMSIPETASINLATGMLYYKGMQVVLSAENIRSFRKMCSKICMEYLKDSEDET